jgi:hypothetical protein
MSECFSRSLAICSHKSDIKKLHTTFTCITIIIVVVVMSTGSIFTDVCSIWQQMFTLCSSISSVYGVCVHVWAVPSQMNKLHFIFCVYVVLLSS